MTIFSDLFEFQNKSRIKAGEGLEIGKYPFYTSSSEQSKFLNDFCYEGDSLIFGTGGTASIHFNSAKFSVSTDCLVARPIISKKILAQYYYHFLKSNIHILEKGFKGAGLKHISKTYISQINLPDTDYQEQKQVVEILNHSEVLRQKRNQSLQLLDEFLRATFLEMFGDPIRNTNKYKKKRISDLGEVITGNTPSRAVQEYYGDFIEWIKSDNINTPSYILTKAKECLSKKGAQIGRIAPKGSILVTCIAGSPGCIGNVAMADRDVAFNQQINAFVPGNEILQEFFFAQILFCKKLIQQVNTNGMKGLVSKGNFSEINIIVPDKGLQELFVKIFNQTQIISNKMQESLIETFNQCNSLKKRFFNN